MRVQAISQSNLHAVGLPACGKQANPAVCTEPAYRSMSLSYLSRLRDVPKTNVFFKKKAPIINYGRFIKFYEAVLVSFWSRF